MLRLGRLCALLAIACLVSTACSGDKNDSPTSPGSSSQARHTISLVNALPWNMGLVLDGAEIAVAVTGNTSALGDIATGNHSWELWENSTGSWLPTTNNGTLYIDRDYTLRFFNAGGFAAYEWVPASRLPGERSVQPSTGAIEFNHER